MISGKEFWARFPRSISHWLGYRENAPKPPPKYLIHVWSFIAAFCGLCVVQVIFKYSSYFIERGVPGIIASYGASAVLVYGAIESPLAQPRALLGGHFLSALVGICITKLFSLMPDEEMFNSLRWIAASLSSAVAIVVMQITETTHPPAGATALLPAVDEAVWALSWYYLPVVLLSSTMILIVALILNNIQRRYPIFWISPPTAKPVLPQTSNSA
ncbi:HPP family protein [Penicillium robsamsonii]|uniref:HPP family protein n=1 Tax=Penicillium robsamsonii TaxID=1792511 RepID=UPI0025489991|nr:HPP family protein [Penicillium robsamsonii]KAJ5822457.1 HPP family protein [Penicillium robsamsonii]